jgi:hypothetical protein
MAQRRKTYLDLLGVSLEMQEEGSRIFRERGGPHLMDARDLLVNSVMVKSVLFCTLVSVAAVFAQRLGYLSTDHDILFALIFGLPMFYAITLVGFIWFALFAGIGHIAAMSAELRRKH